MKHFQAVASTGTISKACNIVHLSQPALTIQIQNLEIELGIKLFERHNRGLILTEEGKILLERVKLLNDWEQETFEKMNSLKSPIGNINIGTYTTASSYLLSAKLKHFFEQYPKISLNYKYTSTDQIISQVKSLELDCAIISEVPKDPGIESINFYNNELILVASSSFKIKSQLNPSDLENISFLSYPLRLDYCYKEIEKKLGKFINKAPTPIVSESFDTLKNSLLAGLGISFMPEYIIKEELKTKKLKKIELKGIKLPINFSFVYRKERILPTKVDVFKNYILSNFN